MEKRYLTWQDAKEYTSMGDCTLEWFLRVERVPIYQEKYGERRYVDKKDIDRAFARRKKVRNTVINLTTERLF